GFVALFAFAATILLCPLMRADLCKPEGPMLTDKAGTPIWVDTDTLVKRARHCVGPKMPALFRQSRIEGQVLVDILVNERGKVECAQLIHGHPLLVGAAIDAAKDWTFRPMKQRGRAVSFYGHLQFHFSTGGYAKGESSCTVAHF